jgi:hypothetical protein
VAVREEDGFGVTDGAGRTHLIDDTDLREEPVCGFPGLVGPAHEVEPGEFLCPDCRKDKGKVKGKRGRQRAADGGAPVLAWDEPPGGDERG